MDLAGVNLPYSLDAEQSVLGAILLDGNANMPKASAKLHPEHFYVKEMCIRDRPVPPSISVLSGYFPSVTSTTVPIGP